jgi:multiple antibiotic resistance protein
VNTVTTLFLSTFTTLLAIINPLAALPVFLKLMEGQDKTAHRRVAWKACSYATLLLFFFLIFGALLLKITVAFVPLAMPLMFGPGAIATVLGMVSFVRHPFAEFPSLTAIVIAILATMFTTYLILAYADAVVRYVGPHGIDAATRIVGFFVAAIGVGLIFHGVTEAIQTYQSAQTH